jgi:hypothetical protein
MVRILWVWERAWRVREKVERRVCAVAGEAVSGGSIHH